MGGSHSKENPIAEVIGEGKYARLVNENGWEYVERLNISGIVGIVAVTNDARLVLVEQYRPAVKHNVIELPAGLAGDESNRDDECLADAARRELLEETGYIAERMDFICDGPPSAGMTNEMISLFMAIGLTKAAEGGGDDNEDIIVHEPRLADIDEWLNAKRADGIFIDLRIYTGVYFINRVVRNMD